MEKKKYAAITAAFFVFSNLYWIVWQFFQSENLFTDTASSIILGLIMIAAAISYLYIVNKEKTEGLTIFYFLFPLALMAADFLLFYFGSRFISFFSAKGSPFSVFLVATITLWYIAICSLCTLIRQKKMGLPKGVALYSPFFIQINIKQMSDPHYIQDANPQKRSSVLANVIFIWASVCAGLFIITAFVNLIFPFIDMSNAFDRFG